MIIWNPWHGCHKVSEGCLHCYMYFLDGKRGTFANGTKVDTSKVYRTENLNIPSEGTHTVKVVMIDSHPYIKNKILTIYE